MSNEHGIQVMAYSNFGPISYVELGMASMDTSPLDLPAVQAIATAHNKSPAQVLLRFAVQRNTVAIPKSSKVERLIENANVYDFSLSSEEMNTIYALNKN